jgi:hypothetical protein
MKNIKILIAVMVFTTLGALINSCTKEENILRNQTGLHQDKIDKAKSNVQTTPNIYETSISEYENIGYIVLMYLDNVPVNALTFNDSTDNWVLFLTKLDETQNEVLEIRKYTNKADYLLYGDENNIPIRNIILVGTILRDYAIENGVIDYYELNGTVPEYYINYENEIYRRYLNKDPIQERNLWLQLYDFCGINESNPSIPMIRTYPFMPWGWNNRVSKFTVVGIYGGLAIFNKTFYSDHLGTFWSWGMNDVCLMGFLADNRLSSGIAIY